MKIVSDGTARGTRVLDDSGKNITAELKVAHIGLDISLSKDVTAVIACRRVKGLDLQIKDVTIIESEPPGEGGSKS